MLESSAQNNQSFRRVMSDRSSVAVKYKHRDRCRTFDSTGHCRFGDSCRYLHSCQDSLSEEKETELFDISNPRENLSNKYEGPVKRSRGTGSARVAKPCLNFAQKGTCRYEDNCRYRHVLPGSREPDEPYCDVDKVDVRSNAAIDDGSAVVLCKVFARTGRCRYETSCRFAHIPPEVLEGQHGDVRPGLYGGGPPPDRGFGPKKSDPRRQQQATRKPLPNKMKCRFFMAGRCRAGDKCKYFHPGNGPFQQGDGEPAGATVAAASRKPPAPRGRPPANPVMTRQTVYNIPELKEDDFLKLRDIEIQQLKKRYPKREEVKTKAGVNYKVIFTPSDPDWAYDVKKIALIVCLPTTYPSDKMEVKLAESDIIPQTVGSCINHEIDAWLTARYTKMVKDEKVELVFRPFIKWLDKQLEDIFTDALKQYKREILAREAGLEFVPATQLKAKYSQMQSEGDEEKSDEEQKADKPGDRQSQEGEGGSEGGEGKENDDPMNTNEEADNNQAAGAVDPARRGTEVKLTSLQLVDNAATLQPTSITLTVQCCRCRNRTELKIPAGQTSSVACAQCSNAQIVAFRAGMAHEFSSVIGYIDVENCVAFDVILPATTFAASCLGCNKTMRLEGIIPGQIKDTWCHHCHGKMRIGSDNVRLAVLQPSEHVTGSVVAIDNKKVRKVPKDPGIKEGFALPNNGTCKHYKKSFRWLRFPCCGKSYPCDVCHDENEDHEMKYANRMICGFCCKEQTYASEKPCIACFSAMTKKTGTHWEGGRGCRDKIKMARGDEKKYASSNKTVSRKSQNLSTTGQKVTKLRHT